MTGLDEKFRIKANDQGYIVSRGVENQIKATDAELIDELSDFPDIFLVKIQEKKLEKKREQYEALKPIGFEYASKKAQIYWYKLVDKEDVQQMKRLQEILAYNPDHTVRLLEIDETFCSDLAGGQSINCDVSMNLAKSKGYHLLSDWNDCDSEIDRKKTDWSRLLDTFGEYSNQGALFSLLDFNDLYAEYWTSTTHENEKNLVRTRTLYMSYCNRTCASMNVSRRVCGFKDKVI